MERIKDKIKRNIFEWLCITPLFTIETKINFLKFFVKRT